MTGKRWGGGNHVTVYGSRLPHWSHSIRLYFEKIAVRVCVLFPLKRLRNVFVTCRDYDPLDSLPPPSPRNTKYFPSNPLVITQVIKQANSQKRVSGKNKRVIYDDDAIAAAVASKYAGHKRPCLILLLLFLLSLLLYYIYLRLGRW